MKTKRNSKDSGNEANEPTAAAAAAEQCSVVHLIDNEVYFLNNRLYHRMDDEQMLIDYAGDKVVFFCHDGKRDSLNQDPGTAKGDYRTIELHLNTAFEVFHRFKEVEQENARRISGL